MCAILHDKYQWLAPGCRLLLTGSPCLSGFTQMETILSQHSHKNQSGPFSFFLLSLPFSLCADSGGAFLLQRVGDNTFICLQGSLWGLTSHFTSFCNFTQTWVSLAGTVVMQCVKTIITQSWFHFLLLCAPDSDVARPNSSCGYRQLFAFWSRLWGRSVFLLVCFRMSFLIIILSSVCLLLGDSLDQEDYTQQKKKTSRVASMCHRCLQSSPRLAASVSVRVVVEVRFRSGTTHRPQVHVLHLIYHLNKFKFEILMSLVEEELVLMFHFRFFKDLNTTVLLTGV